MKIVVIGAGAWGTALAIGASANATCGHTVSLWARDLQQLRTMQADHANARYLPTVSLPASLSLVHWTPGAMSSLSAQDLIIVATARHHDLTLLTSDEVLLDYTGVRTEPSR